tara:strand:- start:139 stop:471 length:333 start_codon:yes stop_codon:yes gene_type:complete
MKKSEIRKLIRKTLLEQRLNMDSMGQTTQSGFGGPKGPMPAGGPRAEFSKNIPLNISQADADELAMRMGQDSIEGFTTGGGVGGDPRKPKKKCRWRFTLFPPGIEIICPD